MTQDVLLRVGDNAYVRTTAVTLLVVAAVGVQAEAQVAPVQPLLPINGLVDAFTGGTLETGRWVVTTAPGGAVRQDGGLLVVVPGDTQGASLVTTRQCYDLTEDAVAVQCVRLRGDNSVSYLVVRGTDGTGYAASLWGGLGYLWLRVTRIGTGALPEAQYVGTELHTSSLVGLTATGTVSYWLRWAESGGTLSCAVAPATADNPPTTGQWVTKWSGTPAIDLDCVTVALVASAEYEAHVGYFDGLNTATSFTDPTQAQDVLLRGTAQATVVTPRFTASALPVVSGQAAVAALGVPVPTVGGEVVRPTGLTAVAGLVAVRGVDSAAIPVGFALPMAVASIDFMPKPTGQAATGAVGVPTVTAPDRLVAVSGLGGTAAHGTPVIRSYADAPTKRRLLLTMASGAD